MTDFREPREGCETVPLRPRPISVRPVSGSFRRGDRLGRYSVLELLGRGGMGEVYTAHDPELDRRVALKVIHSRVRLGCDSHAARARLLREAQTLARVSHPNVIAVYDAGTIGDDVYVTMELVEGCDLRDWLEAGPRSRDQILEVFVAAAEGLAAAHTAGLIHRDVKPENVLIGDDGRVRLIDFGIARFEDDAASAECGGSVDELAPDYDSIGGRGEQLIGTPAYMAPEQRRGGRADARSDQFSLCVALLEALTGERPSGSAPADASMGLVAGGDSPPVAHGDLPSWLAAALERGLARNPEDRFAEMSSLARALTPPQPRRRRLPWIAAFGAATAAVAMLSYSAAGITGHRDPCAGSTAELARVWNPTARTEISEAFSRANAGLAGSSFARTSVRIDRYAGQWSAARVAACREAAAGELSAEASEIRLACLGQRLGELRAVVTVLAAADSGLVENAVRTAAALSPISSCAGLTRSSSVIALGEEIDSALSRIKALERAGRFHQGLDAARALLVRATELDSPVGRARALSWQGRLESHLDRGDVAAETLFEAARLAELAGDRYTRAESWAYVVYVVGVHQRRRLDGLRWSQQAEVAIRQAGSPLDLESKRVYHTGLVLRGLQRYEDALEAFNRSSLLAEQAWGAGSWEHLLSQMGVAMSLRSLERLDEAVALYEQVRRGMIDQLGADNPRLAVVYGNLAQVLGALRRYDESRAHYVRSRELKVARLGSDHPSVQITDHNMAVLAERTGDFEAAERGFLAVHQARLERDGPRYRKLALSLESRGRVAHKRGALETAETLRRRAVAAYAAKGPDAREDTAYARAELCDTLRLRGRLEAARAQCAAAVATFEEDAGDPRNLAFALTSAAHVELVAGRIAVARELADRAQAIRAEHKSDAADAARTRFVLAAAMSRSRDERGDALELTREVVDEIETLHVGDQQLRVPAARLLERLSAVTSR